VWPGARKKQKKYLKVREANIMETLLSQITNEVAVMCPDIDTLQLRIKIAGLLAAYDFKPARTMAAHPDVSEKVKLFLSAKRLEGLSPLTLAGYEIELRTFGKHIQKPVAEIVTADIRTYLGQFEHLKLSSISRKLSVLKSFFGWLTEEEMVPRDPVRKIKPPKKEKLLPKALSIEELEMMRETCQTSRERALVEVFYATGCRLSEVQQLNRNDINWTEKCVKVVGKGSKEREVYLSVKAKYHLKKYLNSRKDAHPALFVTIRNPIRRLSKRGIQREFKMMATRAGIKKNVHPHVLRHTMATLTLNNGADLVAVQELLGHANPGTTQIYAQLSNERKREQHRRYLVL
jgi:integrase/recombinase XerD